MEKLVEYIVTALVDNKDAVVVTSEKVGPEVIITVTVADEDLGRIIGKNGRIAQSIRAIVKSVSVKEKKRYLVKIGDRTK